MNYAPCKGCTERVVGCHSNCEKYKEFKDYVAKIRKNEKKEHISRSTIFMPKHYF